MATVAQPGPRDRVAPDSDRNLALELVRATEAAAINCSRYMGFGDKNEVDRAAVDAMRPVLGSVRMNGIVVIGEGEKDEAPMLYNGERVGDGSGPEWDIADDPVDGTTLTAKTRTQSASSGFLPAARCSPWPAVYMQKLVVPAQAADAVDLDAPIADNLAKIGEATDRSDLTVCILDRPRHPSWSQPSRPVLVSDSCLTAMWPVRSWPPRPQPELICWLASVARPRACWPLASAAWGARCSAG